MTSSFVSAHGRLQRAPSRRTPRRRDLLLATRGADRHRELAASLQPRQAARGPRLQTTSTRGVRARARRVAGCATSNGSAGHATPPAKPRAGEVGARPRRIAGPAVARRERERRAGTGRRIRMRPGTIPVSMNAIGSSRRSHWIRRASVLEIPSVKIPDEHFFERI